LRHAIYQFKAMGSPCEIQAWLPEDAEQGLLAEIAGEALRLESKYSRYRDDSVTSRINRAAGHEAVEIDEETAALLQFAAMSWEQSDGLFDITSGVLRQAWKFDGAYLPAPAQIDALLPLVGWGKVEWTAGSIFLPMEKMEIDFGGMVKEYAVDRLASLCLARGLQHGLVNLGGDLHAFGPRLDGSPWMVGIRRPRGNGLTAGIPLLRGALASSGDYERYIEVGGVRYCHILNPLTGWPSNEWHSASVVAPRCVIAGVASTVAMLKPREEASAWLQALDLPHLLIAGHDVRSHRLQVAG